MQEDKKSFLLGLFIGIAVIALIAFFVLLAVFLKGDKPATNVNSNGNTNQAVNNQPSETGDPSKLSAVTKDSHVRGDYNSPVTMIVFDDFECPYCLRFEDTLKRVESEYAGKVRVVFRNFPLSFHANAEKAAEAAECAGEQGKFWEMHDKIFEANAAGNMSVATWKATAKSLGLNTSQFDSCLDSAKYVDKIKADLAEGQAAGVQGTPASFVNGELVSGALPYETIKAIIDSKL